MKNKISYLLTYIDHFSKYAWAIPIRNKEPITVRNSIAHVFIHDYAELIKSDNRKESKNKIHNAYLAEIEVKNLYGLPYYHQNQGAIDAFNKTVQRSLSAAYDNMKDEKIDWDSEKK